MSHYHFWLEAHTCFLLHCYIEIHPEFKINFVQQKSYDESIKNYVLAKEQNQVPTIVQTYEIGPSSLWTAVTNALATLEQTLCLIIEVIDKGGSIIKTAQWLEEQGLACQSINFL